MRKYDFELLLMRHGDAEDYAEGGDPKRQLTDSGREAVRRTASAFVDFDWIWSKALTSPFLRAKQTADTVYQELTTRYADRFDGTLAEPVEDESLVVHADAHETVKRIAAVGHSLSNARPTLAVFGHNPNLQAVLSLLVTGNTSSRFVLGRGDVAHLFVPAPSPFDVILDTTEEEDLPQASLLAMYPRTTLEKL